MRVQKILVCFFISSLIAMAQYRAGWPGSGMGPLGMGNLNGPSGDYLQMFQGMGGTPMIGSGMGVGMTEDLTVGPDGVAYVIRSVSTGMTPSPSSNSWQFELIAISPIDGSAKWRLPLPAGRVSNPVLASNGLIYVTIDQYQMFYANFASGGSMMTQDQAASSDGQLLVIETSDKSAKILRAIQTASDVLSVPKIVTDNSGGYLIYIVGYDMMSWTSMAASDAASFAPGEKTLYVYRSDGTLKFSVKLSQSGNGMMRP